MTTELVTRDDIDQSADALVCFAQDGEGLGLSAGTRIANDLMAVVEEKHLYAIIKGRKHLLVEAWCTCASLCGVTPRTAWTKRIEDQAGGVVGYEARVEVVRLATGAVIGAAETECWLDEKLAGKPRWTEKHAAKSMAQTRATSKAVAQVLRWIPVLAGYAGTPAEEASDLREAPPQHENPAHDPSAPKAKPRGERAGLPTTVDIGKVLGEWKSLQADEKKATPAAWAEFVFIATGWQFDVRKASNWTADALARVQNELHKILYGSAPPDDLSAPATNQQDIPF